MGQLFASNVRKRSSDSVLLNHDFSRLDDDFYRIADLQSQLFDTIARDNAFDKLATYLHDYERHNVVDSNRLDDAGQLVSGREGHLIVVPEGATRRLGIPGVRHLFRTLEGRTVILRHQERPEIRSCRDRFNRIGSGREFPALRYFGLYGGCPSDVRMLDQQISQCAER